LRLVSHECIILEARISISHTRVVWRTLHKRGKSLTPESKVVIELSRSWRDDCSDVTDAASEEAMMHDIDEEKESIIAASCDVHCL
jgi:hypothetical protein